MAGTLNNQAIQLRLADKVAARLVQQVARFVGIALVAILNVASAQCDLIHLLRSCEIAF